MGTNDIEEGIAELARLLAVLAWVDRAQDVAEARREAASAGEHPSARLVQFSRRAG